MTYSFEIWYRDTGEGFWGVLKDILSQINPDFFQIFKKKFRISKIFFRYVLNE